ncbi:STAS domain-containing protein [Sphingomonas lacusdianchii]|uniref:STAS domain-containing protein n=1 Tax=Sphingomonas lacusdianchii TaxID=2917992 RepID=UPI001F589023|nr:STAS domain-containing protein [Sphingomonas sp. JXJ CY 53]
MTIILDAVLDTAAAGSLRVALRKAIETGQPLVIDAEHVERAGQACLQVLVAARSTAELAGLGFNIQKPSAALTEMTRLAGLDALVAN